MTEQPTPPDGGDDQARGAEDRPGAAEEPRTSTEQQGVTDNLRNLRRSRDERMVAGVLGGLGRRLGIDPVLLRIVTVVLTIFGGVGVVLYAAAWLLIPDEGADHSIAEQALSRGRDRAEPATLWLAVGLVIVVLFAVGASFGSGVGPVLLVLAAAGIIVLLRRDGDTPTSRFTDRAPDDDPAAVRPAEPNVFTAPSESAAYEVSPGRDAPHVTTRDALDDESSEATDDQAAATAASEPLDTASPGDVDRPKYVHSFTAPVQPASAWPDPPDWPAADFDPAGVDTAESATACKSPSSHLTALTLSAAAVALGILAINDATYAVVPASAYVVLALAVIGAGLLIGAWFGRARGLIAWGLFGTLAALPAAAVGDLLDWDMSGEDRTITIDSVAELPTEPQSHGTGRVVYDLGDLQLTDADAPVTLDVSQNVGSMRIVVPPEADVTVNASTGMGHIVAFDEQAGGRQDMTVTDLGADGAGGGELTLDLAIELGEMTVERAGAPAGNVNGQVVTR